MQLTVFCLKYSVNVGAIITGTTILNPVHGSESAMWCSSGIIGVAFTVGPALLKYIMSGMQKILEETQSNGPVCQECPDAIHR